MYWLDKMLLMFTSVILFICVLIGVAYLTLLERKVLGYIQFRKGPNKVGYLGLVQPFSDGIKLFCKEQAYPYMSNFNLYYISPIMSLGLALTLWLSMPFYTYLYSFSLSILFFLGVSSLGVYPIMLAGWASNSNYSLLGSLRSVAQTISYEVSLMMILLSVLILVLSFDLGGVGKYQEYGWFILLMFPLSSMWLVISLAETNRTPFDFAEGESELVSGFNVEYSSGGFAMIFMAEYSSILFMSMIYCMLFLGGCFGSFFFFIKIGCLSFFWVWVRGTLPRYRYDKLMYLAWKSYLPISINYLVFYFSLSILSMLFFF